MKDEKLLALLDSNCRTPLKQLSSKLGISKQAVHNRMKELEKDTILSYLTITNIYELGESNTHLYIKLHGFTDIQLKKKLGKLCKIRNINWVADFVGDYDIGISIFHKSLPELEETLKKVYKLFGGHIRKRDFYFMTRHLIPIARINPGYANYIDVKKIREKEITISELDRFILKCIQSDARFSYLDLADKIGLSRQALKKHIKALEKNKIILGYKILMNYEAQGYTWHAIILRLAPTTDIDEIISDLLNNRNVPFISVTFDGNFIFDFKSKNNNQLREFINSLKDKYKDSIEDYFLLNVNKMHKLKIYGLRKS